MKLTLLDMTQAILSDMSSDVVNSISDTEESLQVANTIKNVYYLLFSNREIPELEGLVELDALADTLHPNYLKLPTNIYKVKWVKYDYDLDGLPSYKPIYYLTQSDFIDRMMAETGSSDIQEITDFSGARYNIRTDKNPQFWTSFDDLYMVFDSFDNTLDTTLQSTKSLVWAQTEDIWEMEDSFIPQIDANMFPMLLAEATSTCFINLKGESNGKAEKNSRNQLVRSQNDLHRFKDLEKRLGPNYGRHR